MTDRRQPMTDASRSVHPSDPPGGAGPDPDVGTDTDARANPDVAIDPDPDVGTDTDARADPDVAIDPDVGADTDARAGVEVDRSQRPGPLLVQPPLGRGSVERSPLPSRPAPTLGAPDRFTERTLQIPVVAAIAVVATVVVGQLWALTVALDAWLDGDDATARWIVAFQAVSFAVALLVWRAAPRAR